jgi:dTDP-4-amino-4,6-dideoxygalactose transaminase
MTTDPEMAKKVTALRAFGRYRGKRGVRSSDLTCQQISSNYRLSEFQSAVLLGQLERFQEQDARRQANASRLTKGLGEIPGIQHIHTGNPSMKHGYYYYFLRYDLEAFGRADPDTLCEALNAEGIPFVPGDRKPLYRHPVFEWENLADSLCPQVLERYRESMTASPPDCPATEAACTCTLILRHQVLLGEPRDMDDIVEAVWKVHKNVQELI